MKLAMATIVAALCTFTLPAAAVGDDRCGVVPDEAVVRAFGEPQFRHADPAGVCSWHLQGGALTVMVHKQSSASQAAALYGSYLKESMGPLKRGVQQPRLGQKAHAAMSVAGAEHHQAAALVLDQERVISVVFMPKDEGGLSEALLAEVVGLAQQAVAMAPAAAQSHGSCEWFTQQEAGGLLATAKPTIHRLGPNHCLASESRQQAALTVMTDKNTTVQSLANQLQGAAAGCTVQPLPELGPQAHVVFACREPGQYAMTIHLLKNGTHAMVTYNPGNRSSGPADLPRLLPIAQRALGKL